MSSVREKLILLAVACGALAGILSVLNKDLLVALMVLTICIFLLSALKIKDKRFVLWVVMTGLLLRVLLAIFYYYFWLYPGNKAFLGPDGEVYSQRGWYISRVLLDKEVERAPSKEYVFSSQRATAEYYQGKLPPLSSYQIGLFSYMIGIFYFLFGYSNLAIKFLNSFIGVFSGVLIYLIAQPIFGKTVARISLVLTIFMPTLFIHSITSLRDPAINLLFLYTLWVLTRLKGTFRWFYWMAIVASLVSIYFLRQDFFYLLTGIVLLVLFFDTTLIKKKRVVLTIMFCLFLIFGLFQSGLMSKIAKKVNPARIGIRHFPFALINESYYKFYPERFYGTVNITLEGITPKEFFGSLVKGVSYFMLIPFPWTLNKKMFVLLYPQMILWYFLIPFGFLGVLYAVRYRFKETYFLIMAMTLTIAMISLGEGNIWVAVRHRDIILPLFFVFASAGLLGRVQEPGK